MRLKLFLAYKIKNGPFGPVNIISIHDISVTDILSYA